MTITSFLDKHGTLLERCWRGRTSSCVSRCRYKEKLCLRLLFNSVFKAADVDILQPGHVVPMGEVKNSHGHDL